MADLIALRAQLASEAANLNLAKQRLDELQTELDNAEGDLPPQLLIKLRQEVIAQARVVRTLQAELDTTQAAYDAAVQADPMHAVDAGLPLLLLPIRIETAYLPTSTGMDLAIRVYPDDIHVDSHEPELTAAELAAGTAYWQAIWGAGSNADRLNNAWHAMLQQLKSSRAAWAVDVLTPAVPRPATETPIDAPQPVPPLPTVPTRPGTFNRAARTTLLPDHWHFLGFRGGGELFNVDGSPIPDSLNVSFGPPGTSANSSDLPFDDASRWLVDLDAAIAVGMAVRIPVLGQSYNVDQLFVLGVSASVTPVDAASRLETILIAHQYTNGLDFLPPGTPTNNTATTRSAWESVPQPPDPMKVAAARAAYAPTSNQNAALAAKALGIDGAPALGATPNGLLDQLSDIATLQAQLWPVSGGLALSKLYTLWDIPAGSPASGGSWVLHADMPTATTLQEHSNGWVRSRGTLPVLRVANQPYGLLPTSSLADWVIAADDPTSTLVTWLRAFRPYWLAAALNVPRVIDGDPSPDATIVNILSRQPVSETLMLRQDGDDFAALQAGAPLPPAPIPGLNMSSELFLAAPSDAAIPSPVPFVADSGIDQKVLGIIRDLIGDSIEVITGVMDQSVWAQRYGGLFGVVGGNNALAELNPDLFTSMIKDSLSDPLLGNSGQVIGVIIFGALEYNLLKNDPNFQKQVADNLPAANDLLARFTRVAAVSTASFDPALRETMDLFSHRYDAWVTSVAARRLDQMRAAKPSGVVIGAYGWIENLNPTAFTPAANPPPGFNPIYANADDMTFIHAPSLHQAATAAVLRAGFESHQHKDAFAVNLVSSRVRIADWLADGIRNGQTLGALLGYRFERGLHEAGLDGLIEELRKAHPLPLPTTDDGVPGSDPAREAIAVRNVVDGLDLYRQRVSVAAQYDGTPQVGVLLNELVNAVDALGDMLLAESVHHLVGGNPLRAGLAADTIGRGESMPDRFDVVATPRGGRALSWQIAALLPADFRSKIAGWNNNRPRAIAEPHVESWLRTMLGPASLWTMQCAITSNGAANPSALTLDALNLCALDVVVESAGGPSLLELRILDQVALAQPRGAEISVSRAPAPDSTLGFGELSDLAARLRTLLAKSSALGPQHMQGPEFSPGLGLNMSELQSRVASLQSSFSNAVQQLQTAQQALNAALAASSPGDLQTTLLAVRSALVAIADHGIPSAYPPVIGTDLSASANILTALAGAMLALVTPLAAKTAPAPPTDTTKPADVGNWFGATAGFVQSIVGKVAPITATYLLPAGSPYATAFAPGAAPPGSDAAGVMVWLRRIARVRPNAQALHDLFLASEIMLASSPALTVAQLPTKAGEPWVALPYTDMASIPKARLSTVALTPSPIDTTTEFCGILFDNWTEHLPGLTSVATASYESAEVTGVSFKVETPDAYPPQAVLLAIAPDTSKGWSIDVLLDVVKETLELAKIRNVDLGDLPRLGRVLPALHSSGNVESMLQSAGLQP
jgi:hypothetical protein